MLINLSYTQCMCYILTLLPSIQCSARKKVFPLCHAIPSSRLVFPRGIRNFLAITYSDNFCRNCHFQVAWTPVIFFSSILVFPLTSTIEGCCLRPSAKTCFLCFSHKKCKTFVVKRLSKMMLETVLCSGNQPWSAFRSQMTVLAGL